jgi:hypothetical protein
VAPILTADPLAALEAGTALSVASADHLVLTLEQQLTPSVHLTTEGFFKRFDGVGGVTRRDLNASGFDLRVLRFGERVTGWLGYSLSWFWESPDALGRADAFTGRHLLSLGMNGRIAGPWSADLAFSYSDGLPLTSVPYPTGQPSSDLAEGPDRPATTRASAARAADAYLRADVEVFADLSPRWGNRTVRVRPYLRVLNALNRRDGMFYYFEPWRDPQLRPLAELSFIPVLGFEWRF